MTKNVNADNRKLFDSYLEKNLKENNKIIGLWAVAEPNVLDNLDAEYVSKDKSDPTGRYLRYFTRGEDGKIALDEIVSKKVLEESNKNGKYEPPYEKSGWGDFYYIPKQRGKNTLTEPYPYVLQGKETLMSSLVKVVKDDNGKFLGTIGLDFGMYSLQKEFDNYKPLGGNVELLSSDFNFIYHNDNKKVGKNISVDESLKDYADKIKNEESFHFEKDGYISYVKKIDLYDTEQHWYIVVNIPLDTLMSEVNNTIKVIMSISILMTVIVILLINLLLNMMFKPLNNLNNAALKLSSGEGVFSRV